MTKDEAIALSKSEFWIGMSHAEIAKFQLFEPKLCMPFGVFHEAVEKALGRHVWTHEFGMNMTGLRKELLGESPAPTMHDIISMIPPEKRLLIIVDEQQEREDDATTDEG